MDVDQRIAQFENMCREDAQNDMAHFSLGSAYRDAGRFDEAAASFERCLDLNPGMSKAWQLRGAVLLAAGQIDDASRVLREGYAVASRRGDLMPKNAIADMLRQLGEEPPEVAQAPATGSEGGSFVCRRTGRSGTQMDRPPFRGRLGEWIMQNISKETFDAWIRQGTKVINELRLDLSRDEDSEIYDRHMREYLGVDDEMYRQITAP
ncbi:MAG: Fe(2+)-trafficking protein [Phycisphaeraceae bacterium]|nr:Fe(2+)-trafficking protein [Phycisphaeraceae bacterium]